MTHTITYDQVVARLEEHGLQYGTLALQDGVSVLVTRRGGRILGPFLSQQGESVFWLSQAFADPSAFGALLDGGAWNVGGDRIWIAPEIQYHIGDRADFWGTYDLPQQVDPGNYTLDCPQPERHHLSMDVTLEAHNLASGRKRLHLERLIGLARDPLRGLDNHAALVDGVIFAGYEQTITLAESQRDEIMSEAWNLVQLNPGGLLLIPASPRVAYADYYQPIDKEHQTIYPDHVRLRITGDRQYKVGYKAAHVFGRLAYFNHLSDGRAYLIVRNFFNNPSAPYVEEPAAQVGSRGYSIHVYNDDGELGGFGELECNGQTIGGETGRSFSTDQFVLWLYIGSDEPVKEIALHLLGTEI